MLNNIHVNRMCYIAIIAISYIFSGCASSSSMLGEGKLVPNVHFPINEIPSMEMGEYTLAYCYRPFEKSLADTPERMNTSVVIWQSGQGNSATIDIVDPGNSRQQIGCFASGIQDFRIGNYSLAWHPEKNKLAISGGFSYGISNLYLFSYVDGLAKINSAGVVLEYQDSFYLPHGISWSPNGKWLSMRGSDSAFESHGDNIWIYNIDTMEARRITEFTEVGEFISHAVWSPDGKKLAISYGELISGIQIADIEYSIDSIDVSNKSEATIHEWPYALRNFAGFFQAIGENNPLTVFNLFIVRISSPVWIEEGRRIIFSAPTNNDRVALFVVNSDGSSLQELVPDLPGLSLLPTISPNGREVAFVRYPSWNDTERVEIATLNLETLEIISLIVLKEPSNGERLFISGMDWTPDGEYLAFSSNHEGRSNIYLISKDGQSWINLTKNLEGDAVNPVWKP